MTGRPDEGAIAALLEALVATPSPSGYEQAAAEVLVEHLARWGLDPWIDAAGNVHAARGPEDAPRVLLLGHVDTVPGKLPVRWEAGTLCGRGAVDAKGALVAHAAALASLEAPDVRVELVAAVGEEADSRGARHLLESAAPPDALVIAEPTGRSTVGLGYRGCLRGRLVAHAEPAHPGAPEATAAERLLRGIDALTTWTGNPSREPGFELATLRVHALTTDHAPEQEHAEARIDLRLPGPVPALGELRADLPEGVALEVDEALPAVRSLARNPVAASLRAGLLETGGRTRQAVKTGTSDWNVLATAWDVPAAAAYGPGDPGLDHTPDERVALDDVVQAAGVLARALTHLSHRIATAEKS